MKTLNVMLKPASSLCNMRCRYCFYADEAAHRATPSYGMMSEAVADAIVSRVSEALSSHDRVHYIFQGGEPTLAGLAFFRRFAARATERRDISVSFSLQTNGLLLDDAWCDLFTEYGFLLGVSLDLLPAVHDAARRDARGEGTYTRVTEALSLLKRRQIPYNVLCTLTSEVAKRPKQVWQRILRLGLDYVQLTPCLGAMEGGTYPDTLTPDLFAAFYRELFALWYADYEKGRRRSIKLFDDVVNLMLLGTPTACGMDGKCRPQLVIEADGSAYPCDFYCTDEYRLGNVTDTAIDALLSSPACHAFASRKGSAPARCTDCKYHRFCGGGCPKMQREVCISEGDFCGYADFLDTCGGTLSHLAEEARRTCFTKKA